MGQHDTTGIVVIGKNEGGRLRRCLASLPVHAHPTVYVDSGSTDGSVDLAASMGVEVLRLDPATAFTAARARNEGAARLLSRHAHLAYLQFVDGDCELADGWLGRARLEMPGHPDRAVVFGHLRQAQGGRGVYDRLLAMEFDTPLGEVGACPGIALVRAQAFVQAGGFRAAMAAGEEPEMCLRLRRLGWKVVKVDAEMALHLGGAGRFGSWWRRACRSGRGYAEGALLHGLENERFWLRESLSICFWGLVLPAAALGLAQPTAGGSLAALLGYPLLIGRIYFRLRGRGYSRKDAAAYGFFCVMGKWPQLLGQLRFLLGPAAGGQTPSIPQGAPGKDPLPAAALKGGDPLLTARIAYLVNRYPHPSHAFIRREIEGVEARGLEVRRFSIRPPIRELVDEKDRAESRRTHVLLSRGFWKRGASALIRLAFRRPTRLFDSLILALSMGVGSNRGTLRHLAYLLEACVLEGLLARGGIGHVHAHFGTNPAAVALLVTALGGPPYSFTAHGPEEFDTAEALCLRLKIERAAFVVAVSSFGRSQLCRWCAPASWRKIHLIHCGVDDEFLGAPPHPVGDGTRLVCLGRLSEAKAHPVLLDAARALRDEGLPFHLVLVGDGPMRAGIERTIARYGLQGRVELTGWGDSAKIKREIIASRALVLPSFAEGLPVTLMEALALGRPVVSTWVAGIPELVTPGVCGWLVPPGSVEELAAAVKEVLLAPSRRLSEMGVIESWDLGFRNEELGFRN